MKHRLTLCERRCLKKKSYETEQQAENHSYIGKNGTVHKLRPYKCNVCALWHLTSKTDKLAK